MRASRAPGSGWSRGGPIMSRRWSRTKAWGAICSIGWSHVYDSEWNTADIGVSPANWTLTDRKMDVSASGGEIGNTADACSFRYFPLNGDGELVARLGSITDASGKAQVGLMLRESLDAGGTECHDLPYQRRSFDL